MAYSLLDEFAKAFTTALERAFVKGDEKRAFGYLWADAESDPRFGAFRQGMWFANRAALGPLGEIFNDHLRDAWPHALEWVIGESLLTQANLEEALGEIHCCGGSAAMLFVRNFRLTPKAALLIAEKARPDWDTNTVLKFARAAPPGLADHILRMLLAAVEWDVISRVIWLLKCGNTGTKTLGRMQLPYLSAVAERLNVQRSSDPYYTDRRMTGETLAQFLIGADKKLGLVGEFLIGATPGDAAEGRCTGDWDKVVLALRKQIACQS